MPNKNLFFLLILFQISVFGQQISDSLTLHLNINFAGKPLNVSEKYISNNQDTLSIDVVKFYLSSFEIIYNDNSKYTEKNSFHLVDINKPESLNIKLLNQKNNIKSLKFSIGIDSLNNVSGAQSGDLDLQNGMYWAWQSGYINMKIEGKSKSCKTQKNKFQLHIGGYQEPNFALRKIELNSKNNGVDNLKLNINLAKFFSKIYLNETNSVMIPGQKAMKIADLFSEIFELE